MDTARIDICYRPLRIAWAIHSSDREAFRRAVRMTHTLVGGRFNPIILVDSPEAADQIELFRADMIVGLGDPAAEIQAFVDRFPHLARPLLRDQILSGSGENGTAHVLDINNLLTHRQHDPEWGLMTNRGIRTFSWDDDDPLADAFLARYGQYPGNEEIGIDYYGAVTNFARPHPVFNFDLHKDRPIPAEVFDHPSIGSLARLGLRRHHSIGAGWEFPGFFVGDAANIHDLVAFWNLRAADIFLEFIDPAHLPRYELMLPRAEMHAEVELSFLHEHRRRIGVWSRRDRLHEAVGILPGIDRAACGVGELTWKGGSVVPPTMQLGSASALGIAGSSSSGPTVTFALQDKPFASDGWFWSQHLVASIVTGMTGRDNRQHTYGLPYIPELNETCSHTMGSSVTKIRLEPGRIGIVINASSQDISLKALPVAQLVDRMFDMIGVVAKPSNGGKIARQLIAQMGGVDQTRAFKIPGVRRLIKQYGPAESFTRKSAYQLIGKRTADESQNFTVHEGLYIEPREVGTKLTVGAVFEHLVAKGLYRVGVELDCPNCDLPSWISVDHLRQRTSCELCGTEFDATRQLVQSEFRYRRSGLLGVERNVQGAIPVALLLQQLVVNIDADRDGLFLPSFDLIPKDGVAPPKCETDFLVVLPGMWPRKKTQVIIGECKDEAGRIDADDIGKLRRIADALPTSRFETFILLAKLGPFTAAELELAKSLNGPHQQQAIVLTARELEPYHIYERTGREEGIAFHGGSPEDLASVTDQVYLK